MIHSPTSAFGATSFSGFVPTPTDQRYSIEAAQLEVWLASQQSEDANCAYNEIATLSFNGPINRSALELALHAIYRRHGSLRATFDRHGREVIERAAAQLKIESHDWRQCEPRQIQELRRQLIDQLGRTPFDLEHGPLFRAIVQCESETRHYLTLVAHHLVLDGWSLAILVKELGEAYDQIQSGGQPHWDQPSVVYADYALAMQQHAASEAGQQDLAYWLSQFEDGVPTLDLPVSSNRVAVHHGTLRSYAAGRIEHRLPASLVVSLRKLGGKSNCSLVNTMLAAFQSFVARLGQTRDVVLAIPTAGQASMDFPGLVGHCVNTLPLRIRIDDKASFSEHLKRSRSALLGGMDHQRCSYGTLLKHLQPKRDPSRPPLCAVSFNLDPVIKDNEIGFSGLSVSVQVEPRAFENFEWFVNGIIHVDQSIEWQVQFNRDLFQAELIAYYMEGFQAYLEYLVDHPDATLGEVPVMSLAQRRTMMVDWNATTLDVPQPSNLPAQFSRQAQATPDRVAVRQHDCQLTYQQLDEQSGRFARFLIQQGVKRGELVGICTPRSPRLLIQLLGILKAGAGYVPLDPQYPVERLRNMCEDSHLSLIVSEQELAETVSVFGKNMVTHEEFMRHESELASSAFSDVQANIAPADICYVIYTSGSTGKPKGVMVPHGAVVNFLYSMKERPGINPQDKVLAITTLSFDIAVLELYLPLLFGGTVVLADWATATDGKKLIETLEREDIQLMQATPATWRMMMAAGWSGKGDLKLLCGGEPMTQELAASLLPRCRELWNMYGPTETTVWSTACRIESVDQPLSIGRPIGNTQVYILDANGQEVPVGVEGELMIGGAGVTLGYWDRTELTNERFIDNPYFNPFAEYVNHRLYKTGDIAVYRPDGNIEYRRRNDKQIKLRGFRIEPGEIESAIHEFADVTQAVVLVRKDSSGDSRLVAYLTANVQPSMHDLREHLRSRLPHYMIPQNFVVLDEMPLTENGKVNIQALPNPESQAAPSEIQPCQTRSELYLEKIWSAVLQQDSISRHDNFFELGGHSLLVMQVINEVESFTRVRLSPQEFLLGTLEQIATQLDDCHELDELELPISAGSESTQQIEQAQPPTNDSKSPFECLKRFGGNAMKPLFFANDSDAIFGAYHPAAIKQGAFDEVASRKAVVICPPFGQESIRSHKSLVSLANRLAKNGVHVLRFAYRGTDDSALWSDEVLSLHDWRQDIVAAKEELKRQSGCDSVMLMGLRLGANLAVDVARKSEDVHSILLWEPIKNGRDYLDNLRSDQREMIDLWHGNVSTGDTEEVEELFSTRYQRSLLAEIEQVRLSTESLSQPTLVISAAQNPNDLPSQLGVFHNEMEKRIESVEPDGWQNLDQLEVTWWRPQSLNQVVTGVEEMFARVEAYGWHHQQSLIGHHRHAGLIRNLIAESRAGNQSHDEVCTDQSTQGCESVIQLGEHTKLTGILTLPPSRRAGAPIVIMLNAGIVHRVGPFRLHVNIARVLARRGIASLRIDLSGLGDSQMRTGKLTKDERVRRDLAETMDYLTKAGLGTNFVLLGLCSGAYQAHQVTVADSRVVGAIFLDGIVFRTRGYYWRHHARRLLSARFWRNAIKRRWLKATRKQRADVNEPGNKLAEAEYFQVDRSQQAIADELRALQIRGTNLLFVYTGDYDDICDRRQFQEMFGIQPNDQIQVDYLQHASHTYRIAKHREELSQRIASWMEGVSSKQ